jgi:CMP-N,N'-diacetyllegionaminic acid synthase
MVYYIDIDDTICRLAIPMDYTSAYPIPVAVKKVNALYEAGHEVNFWTARGTVTGRDWRLLTESQLSAWGIKYHNLYFGKPSYDFFIDDKNINSNDWLNGKR